jgi:hypothetical protein
MLRRVILAGLSTCVLGLAFGFSQTANATWFDSATGQPVHVTPRGGGNAPNSNQATIHDLDGHLINLYWDQACNTWRSSQSGQEVHVTPRGGGNAPDSNQATIHDLDGHLKNLYWVPCPPPSTVSSTFGGGYVGGELAKNWGRVRSTETLAATGAVTNQFTDTADPLGGGIIAGYNFAPWNNNWIVGPFASFDFMHAPVNHTFPSGSYLGTTANFMGTGGVKIGPQLDMGLWLYGIAGVSVLNETLNVNFLPVASSSTATVPGATVGVGGAWQPAFLQGFGRPVSLFLEYQHTWWQSANLNTPAASPLFNYNFARQDDVVKFGFTVSLAAPPPPPPTRHLITK